MIDAHIAPRTTLSHLNTPAIAARRSFHRVVGNLADQAPSSWAQPRATGAAIQDVLDVLMMLFGSCRRGGSGSWVSMIAVDSDAYCRSHPEVSLKNCIVTPLNRSGFTTMGSCPASSKISTRAVATAF